MSWFLLPARSLRYHGRGYLAVAMGAAVSAAVLAGALLVGDSLRGSLRQRAERQLNGTEATLVGGRFFRQQLAAELPATVKPVILLQGTVQAGPMRAGKVTVLGVDAQYGLGEFTPTAGQATLSTALAKQLHAQRGDTLTVSVAKRASLPRSSAFAKKDAQTTTKTMTFTVGAILPNDHPANDFTLVPSPALPLNLILPLESLQQEMEQSERVNTLLASGQSLQPLQAELAKHLTLKDWNIVVRIPPKRNSYLSVESPRLLLEPMVVEAALKAAKEHEANAVPTLVYMTNAIGVKNREIPYSVVAGIDPAAPPELNPVHGLDLKDDEIVLIDWRGTPFKTTPGEKITLTYYNPEVESGLIETKRTFTLKGVIPLANVADDPHFVPEVPGLTDLKKVGGKLVERRSMTEWDLPFDVPGGKIRGEDDRFWSKHRTTPKAYVTLKAAREMWGTRFGNTTSVRIVPKQGEVATLGPKVEAALVQHLNAERGGFVFDPVRERLLEAGRGSTDFGMLFAGFSFFLIGAALMLVGLLFRLNLERRAKEIGLLRATGYPLKRVRRMLLWEGLLVAAVGSALGLVAAIAFARAMLRVLIVLWPSESVGTFLTLHVSPISLAIGFVAAVLMSELAILWAIRGLSKVAPAHLLKGAVTDPKLPQRSRWGWPLVGLGVVGAVGLLFMAPYVPPGEPRAGTFFGGGSMLLLAGLAFVWVWLKQPRRTQVRSLNPLGSRNATRNPTRSLLTAGLLASAAFMLVAVESFRREPDRDFLEVNGGSGGYALLAEADAPVFLDLNAQEGRDEVLKGLEATLRTKPQAERERLLAEAEQRLKSSHVAPFRVQAGDDASCLNLYQAMRPRVLGAPSALLERGGFRFSSTLAKSPEEKANPWLLLMQPGDAIPCFVEENTAIWQLKKGLGQTLTLPDDEGQPVTYQLVGFLKDSVFQSELVVAESAFKKAYPRNEGYGYFLIEGPTAEIDNLAELYALGLSANGLETTPTPERVRSYLAVQNTYLSTFQLLGGFGLLLGVVGMAIVLLRNVWERRAELALFRALGYRTGTLNRLTFVENALLLLLGLGIGIVAAIAAVAPHVASGGSIPWLRLVPMLGGTLLVGLVASALAIILSARTPIVQGLRKE